MSSRPARVLRVAIAVWATTFAGLTACGTPNTTPSSDTRTAGPAASTSASSSGEPVAAEVAGDLAAPWGLVSLEDGSVLVSERDTRKILRVNGSRATTLTTLTAVDPGGEGGLLGLALSPDATQLFAYYTAADDNRIVAMPWDGSQLGEPRVIFSGIPKGSRHNGGRLVVGPDDYLYVGTGDTGDSGLSQDKESLGGKILRITLTGQPAPDNPFGTAVFSFGHRNVQGLTFDAKDRLWASEFGDQAWDELNLITPGGNYGWPEAEGSAQIEGMINPKLVWKTSEASPSGLAFWQGELWMAALQGERLWQIPLNGTDPGVPRPHFPNYGRLRSVLVSHDGKSMLLTASNTDGRGDDRAGDDKLLRVTR